MSYNYREQMRQTEQAKAEAESRAAQEKQRVIDDANRRREEGVRQRQETAEKARELLKRVDATGRLGAVQDQVWEGKGGVTAEDTVTGARVELGHTFSYTHREMATETVVTKHPPSWHNEVGMIGDDPRHGTGTKRVFGPTHSSMRRRVPTGETEEREGHTRLSVSSEVDAFGNIRISVNDERGVSMNVDELTIADPEMADFIRQHAVPPSSSTHIRTALSFAPGELNDTVVQAVGAFLDGALTQDSINRTQGNRLPDQVEKRAKEIG